MQDSSEMSPVAGDKAPVLQSAGQSLFIIFTAVLIQALVVTMFVYSRPVLGGRGERLAVVAGAIIVSILTIGGAVLAALDLWRRSIATWAAWLMIVAGALAAIGLLWAVLAIRHKLHEPPQRVAVLIAVLPGAVTALLAIAMGVLSLVRRARSATGGDASTLPPEAGVPG
jgi:hypothetical protein